MFTSIGLFGNNNLIPVLGYSAYIDFKDSPITLNGSKIAQINDLSGNEYHAVQTIPADQPNWNPDGYYDGQQTANTQSLDWSLLNDLFTINTLSTSNYEFIVACQEQPTTASGFGHRPMKIGDPSGNYIHIVMNAIQFRTDANFGGRGVNFSYATVPTASNSVILYASSKSEPLTAASSVTLFGHVNPLETSNIRTKGWLASGVELSRIGEQFRGEIYFCAVYPKILTPNQRLRIKNWAVNKWNLNLRQV